MLRIEDNTGKRWDKFIEICLEHVLEAIPNEDINGIEKIIILDECPDKDYYWAGGFYNAPHDDIPASIELYPSKIISAQPSFLPKTNFFKKYSIIKLFLHELGHHRYWTQEVEKREYMAERYAIKYLIKLYGKWVYFFDFLGSIDCIFRKNPSAK